MKSVCFMSVLPSFEHWNVFFSSDFQTFFMEGSVFICAYTDEGNIRPCETWKNGDKPLKCIASLYMERAQCHVISITFYCKSFFFWLVYFFLWTCLTLQSSLNCFRFTADYSFLTCSTYFFVRISYFLLLLFIVRERAVLDVWLT